MTPFTSNLDILIPLIISSIILIILLIKGIFFNPYYYIWEDEDVYRLKDFNYYKWALFWAIITLFLFNLALSS